MNRMFGISNCMQDLEGLAKFVRQKMDELNLNSYEVAQRATNKGFKIVHGTVWNVLNQNTKEVKDRTLISLAKGLNVDEEQIFAIARGQSQITDEDIERIELEAMYRKRRNLSPAQKEAFRRILDMVDRELDRMYEEEQKELEHNGKLDKTEK